MQEDPAELFPGKSAGIAIGMELELWQRGKAHEMFGKGES